MTDQIEKPQGKDRTAAPATAAEWCPSPNHGSRKCGPTDILILHYTGMDNADGALKWLCMTESQVSAHYLVFEDGRTVQMVAEDRRAWHAGLASWAGERDINSRSIGIEIANCGHLAREEGDPDAELPPFPAAQVEALTTLCHGILERNPIPPHRVLAHSDVAPGRKCDPGEHFPWDKLSEAGIGHIVPPEPVAGGRFLSRGDTGEPVEALQAMLALYGYGLEITGTFDDATDRVVSAFQRHFRPARVDGIADASTITTLHRLIAALD
ncbi:MAG: N-acetylmuramoyl-L-alanine amidase [Alphaproteobacteria bacterium]